MQKRVRRFWQSLLKFFYVEFRMAQTSSSRRLRDLLLKLSLKTTKMRSKNGRAPNANYQIVMLTSFLVLEGNKQLTTRQFNTIKRVVRLQVEATYTNPFSEFIHVSSSSQTKMQIPSSTLSDSHSALPELPIIFLRSEGS